MPETIIVANWKMNKTIGQAIEFARGLKDALLKKSAAAAVIIAPPFTGLGALATEFRGSNILLAAQNMHPAEQGPFTGEISGKMLADAGCKYCIVGHSERRQFFGEDNALINAKIIAALCSGLKPVFCIGETLTERERGLTFDVIASQVKEGLNKVPAGDIQKTVLAYEPVWAIGTGRTATPAQAQEAHIFIRNLLSEIYGSDKADAISIIYGGSVSVDTIGTLMSQPDINGALVGSASLELESFLAIVNFT
jgi:triosephosphate isomerase (TIM)